MERITWIIIGYVSITPILNAFSLASPSLIVVAILVELVRFFLPYLPTYSVHILIFCSGLTQGEIVARLAVHTTLRGESRMASVVTAKLMA